MAQLMRECVELRGQREREERTWKKNHFYYKENELQKRMEKGIGRKNKTQKNKKTKYKHFSNGRKEEWDKTLSVVLCECMYV